MLALDAVPLTANLVDFDLEGLYAPVKVSVGF